MVYMEVNQLPTKPGPYCWRESDGDEWEPVQVDNAMDVHFLGGTPCCGTKKAGGQWLRIPDAEELVELQRKAEAYDEVMSIRLQDGTRLKVGEFFTLENTYPFFKDGLENYNAILKWDNEDKVMWYDIFPVSDRVAGRACGGAVAELSIGRIRRRKVRVVEEVENE